jgi:hypothetical protein
LQDSEVSSTTTASAVVVAVDAVDEEPTRTGPEFHFVKVLPSRSHCVIRPNEKWYHAATTSAAAAAATAAGSENEINLTYWLPKIEKYAQQAWDLDIKNYEEARKKGKIFKNGSWAINLFCLYCCRKLKNVGPFRIDW